jgi:hypothetical protein
MIVSIGSANTAPKAKVNVRHLLRISIEFLPIAHFPPTGKSEQNGRFFARAITGEYADERYAMANQPLSPRVDADHRSCTVRRQQQRHL